MPLLRVMRVQNEVLVAICDADLLGREFKEGDFRLKPSQSFYCGKEESVEACLEALKEATIANLVGSIVGHAIKAGFINRANVVRIEGVPHAQMVRM